MDRVTKSYIKEFQISFGLEEVIEEATIFEHFVNYTIIDPKTEFRFDIEKINIGSGGTIGIDGFSLLLNKQLIDTIDELNDFLDQHKKAQAEVVFIQSKTVKNFDTKEIGSFGYAVEDFISEDPKLKWTDIGLEKIKLFNKFVERISELREKPICNLFYVTLGINNNDHNIETRRKDTIKNIEEENLFKQINYELIDANELQKRYKKIGKMIEKSFEFPKRITMPMIKNVREAYIGIIDTKTIVNLMINENGELLPNVFYDNVRDFQGENKVNNEIEKTLQNDYKDAFAILNNGITIVAEDLTTARDTFTLYNYQIINGCQTSHVLFNNKDLLDENVKVPLKIVISENEDLTSKVIRSTNRQTEVKEQDLIAFSNFQKRLEDYYKTFTGEDSLFYERRSKQYNNKSIEKKRIIDKTTQMKTIASIYYNKPELATRYFGTLFTELGDKLFKDNHEMFPYYTAAYVYYKIENMFRQNKINRKYKKIKYHLLTMIRNEINKTKCPNFESKKSVEYCEEILSKVKNEIEINKIIISVIKKIDKLKFNLEDNEISKSKEFVKKILEYYR